MLSLPEKSVNPRLLSSFTFSLPNSTVTPISLSDKEGTLFLNSDVTFAQKYQIEWEQTTPVSLLLVKSSSARTHHDPELCLQGLGYELLHEEVVLIGEQPVQRLDIQTHDSQSNDKASVYYWFVSSDQIIQDYSQRVWSELEHPDQEWVLVEIGILNDQQPNSKQLKELFDQLNNVVRQQLL